MSGIPKASVFPLPVHALTQTSLFAKKSGITAAWTFVTLSNLSFSVIVVVSLLSRFRSGHLKLEREVSGYITFYVIKTELLFIVNIS